MKVCEECGTRIPATRRFELTISVWLPRGAPLPETFTEWLERATGVSLEDGPAVPTTLERVVEAATVADDVLEKRLAQGDRGGPW